MLSIRNRLSSIATISKFHTASYQLFKVGDSIKGNLAGIAEDSPGNAVDLQKEVGKFKKSIIVQVPGAFSPACSASHVPGFIKHLADFEKKGIEQIFITTVNDAFVTKAWKEHLGFPPNGKSILRLLADAQGKFAASGDLLFPESVNFFGSERGIRSALVVENGKITHVFEEPDKTSVVVTSAENVLKSL